jgi:uncharacterized protein
MIDRAYISINNTCNLNCNYCSFRATETINNDDAFLDSELFLILKNILVYSNKHQLNKFVIGICGAGEPLLDFNSIKKMVEWAETNDNKEIIHFYTISNGTIITDTMIDFFYKYKNRIDLNISLDGYEELHNLGKACFKDVMEGLKQYRAVFGGYPIIQCTVTRETLKNKEKVIKFFEDEDFKKINFGCLFDISDPELKIPYSEYKKFLKFVADNSSIVARQNKKRKKYDCIVYGNYCGVGRNNPFITKTGVYPCCRFYKNEDFNISTFRATIDEMEKIINKRFEPVTDGKCYFDTYFKRNS